MTRGDVPGPALPSHPPVIARVLGLAGLLPFVAGAAGAWMPAPGDRHWALAALTAYAASIVAFLGGIHWGLAARGGAPAFHLAWGVVPSLVAWVALLAGPGLALGLLAGTLVACYAVDHRSFPPLGLAGWLPLRGLLTAVATASCLAGAYAAR